MGTKTAVIYACVSSIGDRQITFTPIFLRVNRCFYNSKVIFSPKYLEFYSKIDKKRNGIELKSAYFANFRLDYGFFFVHLHTDYNIIRYGK